MSLQYDHAYVFDIAVDRIQQKDPLHPACIRVSVVKDRGHIHEQQGKHIVKILRIAKKDIHGGKDHPYPYIQHGKGNNRVDDSKHAGSERHMIQCNKNKEDAQGQAEIYDCGNVFAEKEKIFRYIDLREDARVRHERLHTSVSGFFKIRKHQVSREEVGCIVLHVPAEKTREYQPHDKECKQRVQDAPSHAESCALVFLFKVALYQLLKKETVLL